MGFSNRAVAAGRTLLVGIQGTRLDDVTAERLATLGVGGVILFGRNIESAPQLVELLADLRRALPAPTLLALDQEGGQVSRLEPLVGKTPAAVRLARAGEQATRAFGAATGSCLRALGFNLDFAPVVDLCAPDATNGIGDRSFGTDPETAAELAGAFLEGLQARGVAGCLKHFPGLGATAVDSHVELPATDRDRARLDACELVPYRRLASTAASVMVGHAYYPALDPDRGTPATLSHPIVSGILRSELDYRGLVVSDDLEMGAVSALDGEGRAAVRAIAAGCDLILYCSDLALAERATQALARRADADPESARRLDAAARAVERLATEWPAPAGSVEAWEHARTELRSASDLD